MSTTIELQGGLGNQLFQLAFLDYISNLNKTTPAIEHTNNNIYKHTSINYFETIFKNWVDMKDSILPEETIFEDNGYPRDWSSLSSNVDRKIVGYFQNYTYILPDFISKLVFSDSILSKYPDIQDSVFIHIRGGDYLHPDHSFLHGVPLDKYYKKAITEFPPDTKFVIFTNDKEYAYQQPFLNTITHSFIEENELDTLYMMSKCKGGICANSTFSWWGAFLNTNRKLVIPSKWFNHPSLNTSGYYFKEATVLEV